MRIFYEFLHHCVQTRSPDRCRALHLWVRRALGEIQVVAMCIQGPPVTTGVSALKLFTKSHHGGQSGPRGTCPDRGPSLPDQLSAVYAPAVTECWNTQVVSLFRPSQRRHSCRARTPLPVTELSTDCNCPAPSSGKKHVSVISPLPNPRVSRLCRLPPPNLSPVDSM